MLFVVGLGNPGPKYQGTRHNVGFAAIDRLAQRHGLSAPRNFKNAEVRRGEIRGQTTVLIQPMTYMNLSGDAVGNILRFYKGEPDDVIVVYDEMDFAPGQVRLKKGGGDAGHKGIHSVSQHIGRDYVRIRIGIGKPDTTGYDHVLSGFSADDQRLVNRSIEDAADAVEGIIEHGLQKTMNQYNRRKPNSENEDSESLQPGRAQNPRPRTGD